MDEKQFLLDYDTEVNVPFILNTDGSVSNVTFKFSTDLPIEEDRDNALFELNVALSDMLKEDAAKAFMQSHRIANEHFILYGGNIDGKILVIQPHQDFCENTWGIRENLHTEYVMFGPGGTVFKDILKKKKIPTEHFCYANLIPFLPLGGSWTKEQVKELYKTFSFVIDELITILQPKIIITMGQEVLETLTGLTFEALDYEDMVKQNIIFEMDNGTYIIPSFTPAFMEHNIYKGNAVLNGLMHKLSTKLSQLLK